MRSLILMIAIVFFMAACGKKEEKKTPNKRVKHAAVVTEEFIYEIWKAPTPQCHASTIAESQGTIVAAWFGGTAEKNKDVGIWVSRKINGIWTMPEEAANGVQNEKLRYPCWNPVLFQPAEGPLYLFYKVGPNPREWWGLYLTSSDAGKSWSKPVKLPKGILGPIKNQPIQLANGDILSPTSTESKTEGWKIYIERSKDNAKTWSVIGPFNDPKEFNAIQPTILNYGNGKLQMLSRTKEGVIAQNWSEDYGKTWSKMNATALPNPNSGIDAVTLKDGRQLLIYNPTGKNWGDRVPLSVALSKDGKTWKRALDLEPVTEKTDREKEEYSYPIVIQTSDGLVHVVYTWNRKTVKHVVLNPEKL